MKEALLFHQSEIIIPGHLWMPRELRELNGVEQLPEWDDVTTRFAELVDGYMRTDFSFELSPDGQELYGGDGSGLREVSRNSLAQAEELVVENPNLGWWLRRTRLEDEEIGEFISMASGEGPNTIIVASDFAPELEDAQEDFRGFNVTRKQTMLRILIRNPDSNTVDMISLTLDGSDRLALEAIYAEFGLEPEPGELLGQRIRVDLPPEEQAGLADSLTGVYDQSLNSQYGGEWYAGRRPADYRNTYDFVCGQRDIVKTCIDLERSGQLTSDLLYDMAATMQKRFEEQQSEKVASIVPRMKTHNSATLSEEMARAGLEARVLGKTFSGCGGTLSGKDEKGGSAWEKLKLAGYGIEIGDLTDWHGGTVHLNSKCVACKEVKGEVGACYICEDCVGNPKRKAEAVTKARAAKRHNEKRAAAAGKASLDGVVQLAA